MPSPVVVLGAGGRTGAECVSTLEQQGKPVRAVVRDPAKYTQSLGNARQGVEVVAGDVGSTDSLRQALKGCSDVIFAASGSGYFRSREVDCEGVKKVVEVCKEQGGKHVVLVSSCLVSPHNRWNPIRIMLNNSRWGLMDSKFEGEEALRRSGVPYTIVRPAGLTTAPAGQGKLVAKQGDKGAGRVSRADVAAVCVAALSDPAAKNVTFELLGSSDNDSPPPLAQQLASLFRGLKPDAPVA
ncbi:hypothetical protein ACK3TF_005041 [Chlorella vulgaris]